MLSVSTIVEYCNIMMGELSVVVETVRVQSEDITLWLPRATMTELPLDNQ